jgi:large repetitive protein
MRGDHALVRGQKLALFIGASIAMTVLSTGQAIASHVSCGQTITTNTTLDSNISGCTGNGVQIGANGITLNLNGFTISGTASGNAVDNSGGFDNITMRNGLIRGSFARGVSLTGATGSSLQNLDISGPGVGILLFDSSDNQVRENEIHDAYIGIQLIGGSNRNTVRGNSASDVANPTSATVGLYLRPSFLNVRPTDNVFLENELVGWDHGLNAIEAGATQVLGNELRDGGPSYGIYFFRSAQATIESNLIYDTAGDGIWVGEGPGTIRGNVVSNSRKYGIYLTRMSTSTVESNTVVESWAGFITLMDSDAVVTHNNFSHNETYGILVDSTARITLLDGNTASFNDESGIEVNKPGSIVRMNTADYNGELGIEAVPGVIDGGGNRAKGNADPRECTNVICM